jgi:hypothetical protein
MIVAADTTEHRGANMHIKSGKRNSEATSKERYSVLDRSRLQAGEWGRDREPPLLRAHPIQGEAALFYDWDGKQGCGNPDRTRYLHGSANERAGGNPRSPPPC